MIQTVTGAINKEDFGAVLMHEHISCASLSFSKAFHSVWLDSAQLRALSCDTLKQTSKKYKLGLMVDGTPVDLGRNVTLLREISEHSGVNIVASSGFYYLESIETINNEPQELAKWLIQECRNGIEDTDIKPGILKCATGDLGITADNRKKLSALGIVQRQTGLPIYVHCFHNDDVAHKQIEILLENGANIEKIIIGHTAIRPDVEYLENILKHGCYICMDQCHCYNDKIHLIADTLVQLCQKGYAGKILISNDYCIHNDSFRREENGLHLSAIQHAEGLGYVLGRLHNEYISANGSEKDWETMICKNPIHVLDV